MSSEGAAIAAALRRTPVYVDPAYESALPRARRAELVRRIRRSPVPVYVVLVPLVSGGTWQSSTQVVAVVQSYLGRDGAYVTLDADFGDVFDVTLYGGTDDQRQVARDAGWAVSYEKQYKTLAARLGRCVDLIATGQGSAVYEKHVPQDKGPVRPPRKRHDDHSLPIGVPVAVVAAAAVAGGLVWLRRRRARAAMEALRLPHTVFGTALTAGDDELRARAERELIELGESAGSDERALDAYTAASRTLERARSTADLAGVLALVRAARGGPPLCYFDPRHGAGTVTVTWRAPGTRPKFDVRVCAACAKAVRDRRAPDVLLDRGRPYYEAETPWAETGYGQRGDLVGRILGE